MDKTLDQLRAENAALEAQQAATPQVEPAKPTDDAAAEQEVTPGAAGPEDEADGQQADVEDWMRGDDQESQGADGAPKAFSHKDIAAAKARLRTQLEAKHQTELEKLKAELEARANQTPQQSARPTREQFFDKDDPDEAFAEALVDWKMNSAAAQQQAQRQQVERERAQLEMAQSVEASVNQHFERAAKLVEQSGIAPEVYQSADGVVRTALEDVFPGEGDQVTDFLIAQLGEGSERVMYNLGVNKGRREELIKLLKDDSRGLRAAVFLGKLSAELTAPAKRKSNAPAPATQVQGDASTNDANSKLQRQYKEAHAKGNVQAAFDLKRQAKTQGVNVTSW